MALPRLFGRGRSGLHGNDAVRLRTSLSGMITLANELKADHNAVLAKLDADAAVGDTNYAATVPVSAADVGAMPRMFGNGGTATHGDAARRFQLKMDALVTLTNELRTDHNALRAKLDADSGVVGTDYTTTEEYQLVTLTGATGGTFTLTYAGQTTGTIAYNAAAATVQTALIALSNIGPSDVVVTGSAGGPYTVRFEGTLANTDVAQMTADGTLLTGTTPTAVVTTVTAGGASSNVTEAASAVFTTHFGKGGSNTHGDHGIAYRETVEHLVEILNDLKARHNAMLVELDADTGVTDTNYAALHIVSSADAA